MGYRIETNQNKIIERFNNFLETGIVDLKGVDDNYLVIRNLLLKAFNSIEDKSDKYNVDLLLGLELFKVFSSQNNFDKMYEANTQFWEYIAIYVIPDIIFQRFDDTKKDKLFNHYHGKNTRIYPMTLYWYINLSWQGNYDDTYKVLKDLSTDAILQLVERPGSIGINVDLYRCLMLKFYEYNKQNPQKSRLRFRSIMKINNSKTSIFRPELYPGGIEKFVDMLFEDLSKQEV